MVNTRDEFVPSDFEAARQASSKLSLAAYDEISLAKQELEMFAGIIYEVQQSAKSAAMTRRDETEGFIGSIASGLDVIVEAILRLESAKTILSSSTKSPE